MPPTPPGQPAKPGNQPGQPQHGNAPQSVAQPSANPVDFDSTLDAITSAIPHLGPTVDRIRWLGHAIVDPA